jgi:undecaprenyl-diphosphatase
MLDNRFRYPSSRVARELLFIGAPLIAFVALLLIVTQSQPTALDRTMIQDLQAFSWGPLSFVPQLSSDVGGGLYGLYILPAIVAATFVATRQWRLLAVLGAVFILHLVLISPKAFVEAYRPSPDFGVEGAGGLSSFPSGHVQWSVSFYGLMAFLLWQRWQQAAARIAIAMTYAAIVLMTMVARMDLGRHWPIDTVAGVLAGIIAVRILILLHDWATKPVATEIIPVDRSAK